MMFQETITDLSSKTIRLVKDGVAVPATLSYVPEMIYNEKTRGEKQETTKKKVRLVVTDKLADNATYQLQYAPDGTTVVASRTYKTAASLKISRIEMVSYSKVCVYTNNQLDNTMLDTNAEHPLLTTTPKSRIQSIGQEQYMPDELWNELYKLTKNNVGKFLADNGFCPQPKADEVLYAVNTRLNPSTSYTLQFTVKDIYGTTLAPITKTFVTGKIQDKDKFLYMGYPAKNTIPSTVPLIVNIQSINTPTANISVCAMDVQQYLQSKRTNITYDASGNQMTSVASCTQSFAKDITIKNNNWLLTNTRIDIEKDLGGKTIKSPIIRVVGSLKTNDPIAKKR